jgi:hypothetical protein
MTWWHVKILRLVTQFEHIVLLQHHYCVMMIVWHDHWTCSTQLLDSAVLTLLTHRFASFDVLCQMIRKSSKPRFFDPHARLDLHDRWRLLDDIVCNIERHSSAPFKTVYKLIVSVERSAPVDDTFDFCSSRCWGLLILLSTQSTSAPQAADSSHGHVFWHHGHVHTTVPSLTLVSSDATPTTRV